MADSDKLRAAVVTLWRKSLCSQDAAALAEIDQSLAHVEQTIERAMPDGELKSSAAGRLKAIRQLAETSMIERASGVDEWLEKADAAYRFSLYRLH